MFGPVSNSFDEISGSMAGALSPLIALSIAFVSLLAFHRRTLYRQHTVKMSGLPYSVSVAGTVPFRVHDLHRGDVRTKGP